MSTPYLYLSAAAVAAMSAPAVAQTLSGTAPATPSAQTSTVVVAGKRADVINKIDRKVYRTDADLQSTTGSAADIMNNIPSVDVDMDGNVSLRGDSSVTVLIDGKPSSQMQGAGRGGALQGFSAADIEQIEVITSPSAEFKPDGAGGIINIVTRRKHKRGASGQALANLGNDGRHNGSVGGSYSTGDLELSGTLGERKDTRRRVSDNRSGPAGAADAGTNLLRLVQDEDNDRRYAKSALKYTPNDTQALGLTLDYLHRTERRITGEHDLPAGAPAYDRFGNGGGPRTDAAASLTFDQKLSHPGEALSFYLQRSHSVEDNRYDYAMPSQAIARQRDFGQEAYDVAKFTGAYVRPDADGATLKLGYDVEANRNGFNNASATAGANAPLTANLLANNHFRYRQLVNAVYATYGKKLGALETLSGLRYEQVDIRTLQLVSGDASAQRYSKLYPTLNLLYTLNDNDVLTLGYSKRVRKPDPEDLNPYVNAADPKNLRQGNPQTLRPQLTDALEAGYRHEADGATQALTVYWRRSRDGDTEVLTPLDNDVVLVTKANLPGSQAGGIEFSAAGKLLATLGYNVSGNAFYNQINAQALGGSLSAVGTRSNVGFNGKGTLDYQAGAGDRVQLGANYKGKRLTPQGYVLPITVFNLGWRHQVDAQLTAVLTVSDLFNGQRNRRVYEVPGFSGTYRRQQMGQVAYIGLAYTFGGGKKGKDAEFNYD